MKNFLYLGRPLTAVSKNKIVAIDEQTNENRYDLRVFVDGRNVYRNYHLPKSKMKRKPQIGDTLTTYEFFADVVGCDLNEEIQFRNSGMEEKD